MAWQKQHRCQRSRKGNGLGVLNPWTGGPTAFWARESTRYCRWFSWRRAQAENGVTGGAAPGATHWRR
jgi:hypothetical protein